MATVELVWHLAHQDSEVESGCTSSLFIYNKTTLRHLQFT